MKLTSIFKSLSLILMMVFGTQILNAQEDFTKSADLFLKGHVYSGKVNYRSVIKHKDDFNKLINLIGEMDMTSLSSIEKKAFLINSYNLLVMKGVIDNYPIKSPMDVSGFFNAIKYNVGGKKTTLDALENKILRPTYKDARLHFVLVCGAQGCPPIENFAYDAKMLEAQLEKQASKALNNNGFVYQKDGKNYLSEIFKWYTQDFTMGGTKVVEYINKYRNEDLPVSQKTAYYSYDWSLNETNVAIATSDQLETKMKEDVKASEIKSEIKDHEKTSFNETEEIKIADFNFQTYNAGSLLRKGQMDITLFNSLYTQTESNWLGQNFTDQRASFYTTLFQFTYGISNNSRFNLGFDINLKGSGFTSDLSAAGAFLPFQAKNTDSTRFGVTSIGPRIKFSPFESAPDFTIQTTLLVPTIKSAEGDPSQGLAFIDWNRITLWNQFFYGKMLANNKLQLFLEGDILFRFGSRSTALDLPAKVFLSYFPSSKITFYALAERLSRFRYTAVNDTTDILTTPANYTAAGLGFKYQITPKLNVELLYTKFLTVVNQGLGNTFNVGFKYIH